MKDYKPQEIEKKWQEIWEKTGIYKTRDDDRLPKFYSLAMFPYPSGDLHTGHWWAFGPADTYSRYKHLAGFNVLHPFGYDSFGLPAENAAIKRDILPARWTAQNTANMTRQITQMGPMYDWEKLVDTSAPDYYKWTQWLFLLLYKNKLAYRAKGWQNWCPSCQTVLANEQVVGESNVCERCGTPVIKKELEQWFFKITDYAEALLEGLNRIDWPEKIKTMQKNWIGRSEGAGIEFDVEGMKKTIEVFTTRPDTLFGATYMVIAPEHPLVDAITTKEQKADVNSYRAEAANETELDRISEIKDKTGVFTGSYAINPINKEKIPIWIADYVLMNYGTGAIMAVPAHDERDFEFAKKYSLPIKEVVKSPHKSENNVYIGEGKMTNSGKFDGKNSQEAKKLIVEELEKQKKGEFNVSYKLRDWLISRQRYWGAPIPIIYCDKCGVVPVPESDLPVELPLEVHFKPTGKSPLSELPEFYETKCPECGSDAKRETDTMDTFVDSSWYFLRYPNPNYEKGMFDPEAVKKWLPVDQYMGGVEHAILHLLYARFITKVLNDQKLVDFDEPFTKLFNQGIILGPDGQKMSKSRGNVVNPDDWVGNYGGDTFRMYLMFTGPWDQGGPFDKRGIAGVFRFLVRVWTFVQEFDETDSRRVRNSVAETAALRILHKTIKNVGQSYEKFRFNTAISQLMEGLNDLQKIRLDFGFENKDVWRGILESYLILMHPLVPHITEELWNKLGHDESVFTADWPKYDPKLIKEDIMTLVVQVDGKVRDTIEVEAGIDEKAATELAKKSHKVKQHTKKGISKTIFVKPKLVSIVTKP